ncbi:MAG: hypothetical protein WB778_00210 [Thermoplasmata archaeon]
MAHGEGTPSILRRLFEAAGYRLTDHADGLLAVRMRDRRAVVVVRSLRSPADLESIFPADVVHRSIVYAEEPGAVARSLAAERNMEILDPSTLGPALGELLLPSAVGPMGVLVEEVGVPSALDPPSALFPEGVRTVRPRLSREEAEELAGVEGFRITLRLVPFYVAGYRVRSPAAHGGTGPSSEHLVAVNALSRRVEVWEPGDRELVDELAEPHQRLEPQVNEAQARLLAEQTLRRRHSVSVDHTEQHGGALVIETRKISPGPEDVRIGALTLLHVPFWYAEGTEGRVVLDAVTGGRSTPEGAEATTSP